jgi:hypothetical protein
MISRTLDVISSSGSSAGVAASGNYTSIDPTTGRGTGSMNLIGGPAATSVVVTTPPGMARAGHKAGRSFRAGSAGAIAKRGYREKTAKNASRRNFECSTQSSIEAG